MLNAFRRQRTDHLRLRLTLLELLLVLNAFRRQRTDHFPIVILHDGAIVCSTPFGVRGRITSGSVGF